ncbi:MAG TPA: UbiA family prenyltransferase [Rhizomicrobium sp.]|nr:UbiA family prenyltransferase [Rhizomicrobium sp.]
MASASPEPRTGAIPLVVDLDGTLIRSDLLIESGFELAGRAPLSIPGIAVALCRGKAWLKDHIASRIAFDPSTLPYNEAVLDYIRAARADGRPVFLASASNERLVKAIAGHLALFEDWFASDAKTNLSSATKASRLVLGFGETGFDYIGNGEADLAVWKACARPIAVGASAGLKRKLTAAGLEPEYLPSPRASLADWLRLVRVHQFVKNVLVFVPLLTAHKFELPAILNAALAAVAFCLCAASVYVLNDLVDLNADRDHPQKRFRPLAAGLIPVAHAVLAVPLLALSAAVVASTVSWSFFAVLLTYFVLTTAYTFILKRKMLVDIVVLAILYTARVVGGAVAIDVIISEWLFGFSFFIFVALALIKRYVELAMRLDAGLPDPSNRNYVSTDLPIVGMLAAAAGFNAITIFALYISSDAVHGLYRNPQLLWLICPILLYWIGRMLLLANRRVILDDPLAFALRDWRSVIAGICIGAVMFAAI